METEIWQRLALERDPFPHSGPDDLFLQTPGLNQRLSLFVQLAQSSDLTLLLLGDPGAGKSAFIGKVPAQLDNSWRVINWHAFRGATPGDLLQVLTLGFAVTPGDSVDDLTFESLHEHMRALQASGYNSLLIVDDADDLADAELQMVLKLSTDTPMQLALAGSNSLAERVAIGSVDSGLVHRIALSDLTLPQTADYIYARLTHAGWDGHNPFNAEVCTQVFEETQGNPGAIHRAAAEVLDQIALEPLQSPPNLQPDENRPKLDPVRMDPIKIRARLTTHAPIQPRITLHTRRSATSMRALGYAGIGLIVFAGIVFGLTRDSGDPTEPTPSELANGVKGGSENAPIFPLAATEEPINPARNGELPALAIAPPPRPAPVLAKPGEALPPGPVILTTAGSEAGPVATPAKLPRPRPRPNNLTGPGPADVIDNTTSTASDALATTAATPDDVVTTAVATAADSLSSQTAALLSAASEATDDVATTTITITPPVGSLPRPRFRDRRRRGDPPSDDAIAPSMRTSTLDKATTNRIRVEERTLPRPPALPSRVFETVRLARRDTSVNDSRPGPIAPVTPELWLSPANQELYTVQLIVLGSVEKADEFIDRFSLREALVVALRTPDAKRLFAVILGVHEARDTAQAAIRRLPPGVRQERPWPRRIGAVLDAAVSVRAPR